MKNIVSYQMFTRDLSLKRLVNFYFICQQSDSKLFLYQGGKASRIHRMTELILFVMTAKDEKVLIVVEGQQAPITMGRLIECVYGTKEYTYEANSI